MSGQRRTQYFRDPPFAVFGTRLLAVRTARGLSQMELSLRADRHFTFVSGIERGKRNVTLLTILFLAEALQVNPAIFVTTDEQEFAAAVAVLTPFEPETRR